MMKRALGIAVLALAASAMFAESVLAKNIVVDKNEAAPFNCQPTVKPVNRRTTIQAAVTLALISDTVLVCPGQYPEQVVIDKAITLKGAADLTGGNLTVITRPVAADGGYQAPVLLVDSLHYGEPPPGHEPSQPLVAPQVLVQGPGASYAKVLNLAVDGGFEPKSSSACPPPGAASAYRSVGIFFKNVGTPADSAAGGTIGNVSVRNQYADGCPGLKGVGILAENSYISVLDSNVHSIIGDGVVQRGGVAFVQRNFLMDVTDYSVWMYNGTASDVRTNTIIHTNEAVLVHASADTDVVSNVIGPYVGTGIHLANDSGTNVASNRMIYTGVGIWVNESSGATVTGNIVQLSGTGIIDKYSFGGTNVIKSNEVNEALVGLNAVNPGTDVLTPNTYTNVTTATVIEVVP